MKILTDLLFWISPILEIWRFLPTCDRQFRLFQKLEAWRKLTEALRLLKGDNFSYFLSCLGKILFVGFWAKSCKHIPDTSKLTKILNNFKDGNINLKSQIVHCLEMIWGTCWWEYIFSIVGGQTENMGDDLGREYLCKWNHIWQKTRLDEGDVKS